MRIELKLLFGFVVLCIFINLSNITNVYDHQIDLSLSKSAIKSTFLKEQSINYYRTGAAIHVNFRPRDLNELNTMLYPSWKYINSLSHLTQAELQKHSQINYESNNSVTIDLLLFCEPTICDALPIDCIPLQVLIERNITKISSLEPAKCYYHTLDAKYQSDSMKSTNYVFMPSLVFMTEEPFLSVHSMYDYILRADMDTLLTPLSLVWIPPNKYSFSKGWMSTPFTQQRLELVANKLGLKHAKVHQLHATFYASTEKYQALISLTVNLTEHFYVKEFTAEICSELDQKNHKNDTVTVTGSNGEVVSTICTWPWWHQGVSSMYDGNLAINHLFYDDGINSNAEDEWLSEKIKYANSNLPNAILTHLVTEKTKYLIALKSVSTKESIRKLCKEWTNNKQYFMNLGTIVSAQSTYEYAQRIISHSTLDACRTLMV